ncbi:unnamed protein product [Brassica oleracea var. botrytis]|uniref:3'-5' exonuclease domain-containing protein n=2 Tax=Brassica TaxID=3705 RepID=A0A3P6FY47_BRAOL|nr:unnamed protein product [Brassica oleracea]
MSSSIVDLGVARVETTVTRETSEFNRLVKTFLSNNLNMKKIIGLDTERAMKPGKLTKTVLLQLCDGDHCLIVQLHPYDYVELPLSLFNFLNLPNFTFVGIGINKSLMMLESEFGLTCKNAVDIGPAYPDFEDWCTHALSKDQIKLAVSNAYLAFRIGIFLLAGFKVY